MALPRLRDLPRLRLKIPGSNDLRRAVFLRDLPRLRVRRLAMDSVCLRQSHRQAGRKAPLPVNSGAHLTRSGGQGAKEYPHYHACCRNPPTSGDGQKKAPVDYDTGLDLRSL